MFITSAQPGNGAIEAKFLNPLCEKRAWRLRSCHTNNRAAAANHLLLQRQRSAINLRQATTFLPTNVLHSSNLGGGGCFPASDRCGGSATFPYAKHNIYPIQQKDRGCGSSGLVDGIYFILLRSPWLQSPLQLQRQSPPGRKCHWRQIGCQCCSPGHGRKSGCRKRGHCTLSVRRPCRLHRGS